MILGGIVYEPDPRHADTIVKTMGCSEAKGVSSPGVAQHTADDETPLGDMDAKTFKSIVARANYLAQGRCDLQFPVKDLASRMSCPRARDWLALKRLARYLREVPRMTTFLSMAG